MNLGDNKAIKTGQWFANEILRDEDINYIGKATYQNITDQLALRATQTSVDEVITGLVLSPDNLLTLSLSAGAAVSFSGTYMTSGTWGFVAGSGDVFSVILPVDEEVAISTADPTNPRIDVVEIRPIEIFYDSKARQFKDPVTGLVSTATVNTKKEYGFEVQVLEGTAAASPSAPSKTAGWIKLAEVYVEATATTIGAEKIATVFGSSEWAEDDGSTISAEPMRSNTAVDIPATAASNPLDVHRLLNNIPKDLNGHTLTVTYATASYDLEGLGSQFWYFKNGKIVVTGTGISFGDPDTELTTDNSMVAGLNFRYMRNISVEVEIIKLVQCTFGFVDNINCDLVITDTSRFDPANDALDSAYIDIQNCASVELGLMEVIVSGTATPSYPVYIQNVPVIVDLPSFEATAIAACDYYARFSNVVVQNSSNIVNGTVGDIHTSSSNYTLLDIVMDSTPHFISFYRSSNNMDALNTHFTSRFSETLIPIGATVFATGTLETTGFGAVNGDMVINSLRRDSATLWSLIGIEYDTGNTELAGITLDIDTASGIAANYRMTGLVYPHFVR